MNDRKIKYVDLNGLQFFADELRRYLNQNILNAPALTELKVRVENLEDRDFYKIIESYDKLPNPGLEKIIYLVPNNGSFLEYLWVENKYEQLGSFTPQLSLDQYLRVEDSPWEKGEAENNAVLKGGNNQATNANEVALGKYNKSNSGTYLSIGIGTSDTARKNAFEVKQNGDVYITGIGGFTGSNSSSSKSVQEVINDWGGILIVEHSNTLSKDYVIDVYNKISDAILSGKIYTIYVDNKTDNTIYGNVQISSIGSNNVHLSHTIMYPDGNVYIHRHTYHANGHYDFVKGTYNLKKISELETKLNEITTND